MTLFFVDTPHRLRSGLVGVFSILLLILLSGCASFGERHLKTRLAFERGELETAQTQIDAALKKSRKGDTDVLKLNKAIILLSNGRAAEAEKLLREVRDSFDENEAKNLAKGVAAILSDDNALPYAGEDYEKVLIRVFLALANLMHDGSDATAYALQVQKKQNDIIESGRVKDPDDAAKTINPKASYKQVAIAPYLIGITKEQTYRDFDDAQRAFEAVCAWEPNFQQGKADLERARRGVPCQNGNGVVYVFGLVGAGPYKMQQNCAPMQEALFWSTLFFNMVGKHHTVTLGVAPVMIPAVIRPHEDVAALGVAVNGRHVGQTETITDIGRMAEEQFEAVKPQIVGRALVRRIVKKGVLYGAKEVGKMNDWAGLGLDLIGILWEATETADTRCWSLLPAEIQVLRIELPAGEHTLSLQPMSRIRSLSTGSYIITKDTIPTGQPYQKKINVRAGQNNFVLANFPGRELVGEIVTER